MSKKFLGLKIIALGILFGAAISYGWTEPAAAPPDGNVPAPLNVGPDGQSKSGGLILNTGGAVNGLIVDKGNVVVTGSAGTILSDAYPNFPGWSSNPTSSCGGTNMMGGYNLFGVGAFTQKTITSLPAGNYTVTFNYYHVDSWDGESGRFFWNGVQVWSRAHTLGGTNVCGGSWGDSTGLSYATVSLTISHGGGNATLKFDSTLDQGASDESWGVDFITVASLTGGNVGIGTTNPTNILSIVGANKDVEHYSYDACPGCGADYDFYRARGTATSPLSALEGDKVGSIRFNVRDNFGGFYTGAQIQAKAEGSWSSVPGDVPTGLEFLTVPNVSVAPAGTLTTRMVIRNSGNVGIGTTDPTQKLYVSGNIYATGNITCGGSCGGGGSSQWTTSGSNIYYNSGNVGIGTANPREKLEVNGAIKFTPDGSVISKAPRVIHTEDPVSGCPPARAANSNLFTQTFSLSRSASVYITAQIIRNMSGRADLQLFVDGSQKDQTLTYTPSSQWEDANVQWSGVLSVGSHTVSLRSPTANVWGCGASWGSIDTIIFE